MSRCEAVRDYLLKVIKPQYGLLISFYNSISTRFLEVGVTHAFVKIRVNAFEPLQSDPTRRNDRGATGQNKRQVLIVIGLLKMTI